MSRYTCHSSPLKGASNTAPVVEQMLLCALGLEVVCLGASDANLRQQGPIRRCYAEGGEGDSCVRRLLHLQLRALDMVGFGKGILTNDLPNHRTSEDDDEGAYFKVFRFHETILSFGDWIPRALLLLVDFWVMILASYIEVRPRHIGIPFFPSKMPKFQVEVFGIWIRHHRAETIAYFWWCLHPPWWPHPQKPVEV